MLSEEPKNVIEAFKAHVKEIRIKVTHNLLHRLIYMLTLNKVIVNAYPFIKALADTSIVDNMKVLKIINVIEKCVLNYTKHLYERLKWLEENGQKFSILLLKNPIIPYDITRDIDIYMSEEDHEAENIIEEINSHAKIIFDVYSKYKLAKEIKYADRLIEKSSIIDTVKILNVEDLSYVKFKILCTSRTVNAYIYIDNMIRNRFITLYDIAFIIKNYTLLRGSPFIHRLRNLLFIKNFNAYPSIMLHKYNIKENPFNALKYVAAFLVKVNLYKCLPVYGDLTSYLLKFYEF